MVRYVQQLSQRIYKIARFLDALINKVYRNVAKLVVYAGVSLLQLLVFRVQRLQE